MSAPDTDSLADTVDKAWRDGPRLVMHEKKAVLPKRCVVCNAPTDGAWIRVRGRAAVPFLSVSESGPIAMLSAPTARLRVGVCEYHRKRQLLHRRVFVMMFAPGMLAFAVMFLSVVLLGIRDPKFHVSFAFWSMMGTGASILCFVFLVGAVVSVLTRPRLVTVAKIDKPFVWLDNVHPEYLAECPELPR